MKKFSQILDDLRSVVRSSRSGKKNGFQSGPHSSRVRELRLEQLENRALLSVSGVGDERDTASLVEVTEAAPIAAMEVLSESDVISLHYELPELLMQTVGETETGSIISSAIMPGAEQFGLEGEVILPVIPVEVVIPYGSDVSSIEVVADGNIVLSGSYLLEEESPQLAIGSTTQPQSGSENTILEVASEPEDASSGLYDLIGTQWRRGVEMIVINLTPVQYAAETGTVSYYTSMTLNVNLTSENFSLESDDTTISYRTDDIRPLENDVANPEALATYVESDIVSYDSTLGICSPSDSYEYVVITNQAMVNSSSDYTVDDLVAYKQAHGMSATIVTVEDIYANYTGVDQPEQIRNFIIDAYSNWETDFVLLGGDTNIIPHRCLWVNISDLTLDQQLVPSDLYYQCLDGDFNYDGDAYWGEKNDGVNGGEVDLAAEVYIGRVSAGSTAEMANWVYKNMAYEDSATDPYRFDAVMLGEYLGFGGISDYATASMEEIRLGTSAYGYTTAGFASNSSFTTSTFYDSDTYTWSSTNLINSFNSDTHGIYNHLGHANTSYVMKLYNSTVDSSLTNDNFFFAYSQGCYAGNFPSNTIAEHFTTSTRHGAAAVVFNSHYGWGRGDSTNGGSQRPNREFWDALFGEGLTQLGAMNADSHQDSLLGFSSSYVRYATYETNLFGDPAANIVSFDLSVTDSTPEDGSTVATAPTDFAISFSDLYLPASVDASDLEVNGIAADSFTLTDSNTITFHYATSPVTQQGSQTMSIAAGSILRASDSGSVRAWEGSFRYDATGVSVVITYPNENATAVVPLYYLQIDFDEAVDSWSVGTDDLTLSQGSVISAVMVDADTVRYGLSGVVSEGAFTFNLATGAVTDNWGNPGEAYTGHLKLDTVIIPLPTSLTPAAPLGSLVYSGSTSTSTISPGSDTDSFTIQLDAGQTLSALVTPGSGLRPTVTLTGLGGAVLESGAASGANRGAVLQATTVPTAGTYTVTVGSYDEATSGTFTLELIVNAVLEDEPYSHVSNDSLASAQDISVGFVQLMESSMQRGAVLGSLRSPKAEGTVVLREGFETGSLGASWSTYTSNPHGRIQVTGVQNAAAGSYALTMDTDTSGTFALNEAVWTVNLSSVDSPTLSFYSREWSDNSHNFSGSFIDHYNADGVAISDDGVNWYPVWNNSSKNGWEKFTIDLAAEAAKYGLTLNSAFKIKFQQYDNSPISTDGAGFDQIEITSIAPPDADWYQFTLASGETSTLALAGDTTDMSLELYDSVGSLVASGGPGQDFVEVINSFTATASGTYYARVAGYGDDYQMLVTKNIDLDMGQNGSKETAQLLSASSVVLGYLDSGNEGIVVEPDDYATGTVLTDVVPEVTLTVSGSTTYSVTSQPSFYSSTGTQVFAHGTNEDWFSDGYQLRADFSDPATSVSIDVISDDYDDPVTLKAYNSWGTLLREVVATPDFMNTPMTVTVTWSTADIAYIIVAGQNGNTVMLDNLVVMGAAIKSDYYKVQVSAGDSLTLSTMTPADGSYEFVNELDPVIELYNPTGAMVAWDDNSATDGRNAELTYNATAGGEYTVRVLAADDANGEYALSVDITQAATMARLPGDANLDGIVDGSDAAILASNWQMTGVGWAGGDFNEDGIVDGSDSALLSANWLKTFEDHVGNTATDTLAQTETKSVAKFTPQLAVATVPERSSLPARRTITPITKSTDMVLAQSTAWNNTDLTAIAKELVSVSAKKAKHASDELFALELDPYADFE